MSLVVVTSARTSPGATSLCVGLAMAMRGWNLDPLLVEADPVGGVLGHRFGVSGQRAQRNLLTFAVDTRRKFSGTALANNLQSIAGVEALLAPVDPTKAKQAVRQASPVIVEHLVGAGRVVIADLGRVHPESVALRLAQAADAALIVLEPQIDQIQAALFQLAALRRAGVNPKLVLVGERPYGRDDVEFSTEAAIAGVLPKSSKTAVALSGGKFKQSTFERSPLWRSLIAIARPLAEELTGTVATRINQPAQANQPAHVNQPTPVFRDEPPLPPAPPLESTSPQPAPERMQRPPIQAPPIQAPPIQAPAPVAQDCAPSAPTPSTPAPSPTAVAEAPIAQRPNAITIQTPRRVVEQIPPTPSVQMLGADLDTPPPPPPPPPEPQSVVISTVATASFTNDSDETMPSTAALALIRSITDESTPTDQLTEESRQ